MTSPVRGSKTVSPLRAAVRVGEEGLQVGRQQPLGAALEGLRQLFPQLLEHGVVGRALGVPGRVLLRVHRGHEDLLLVVGQAGGNVLQSEEHRVADDVEEGAGHESRPLPGDLAVAATAAVAPVLHRVVVGLADGDLLEAVPLDPAPLVGAPELRPDLRREPVEQVEDGRGVAAEERAGQAEGLAAHVCKDARGDALGRASPLELMHLVADQQVEEALHPVLDVVGQRIAGRAGPVGLPQRGVAGGAGVLAAVQVGVREGHPVLIDYLRRAVGAAGDPEGLPSLLLPQEPSLRDGPPLYHGGHPAVGQFGFLTAHHREQRAGADGEAQPLQVGDGLDDRGADAGHRHLHLPLPLGHQVGRADDEDALESRHVRRRRADECLAGAHLAHYRRAPVGLEGEGRAPDGVGLRPQGLSEQPGERAAVLRGAVERRVGLHHPPGDGVLERVDETSEVHVSRPPFP